jgi:desampylase
VLVLSEILRARLRSEAREAFPRECCGLIEGVRDGAAVRVEALHSTANLAADPASGFEIDPAVHLRLLRTLRGTGREIVGCYHSHPNGRAGPSDRDRAAGAADGFVWVIAALAATDGPVEIVAFAGPAFAPEGLEP